MQRPRLSTVAWVVLPAVLALALAAFLFTRFHRVAVTFRMATMLGADALWAALLLIGFYGWGCAVNRALFPKDRADVGLRLAWGTAFAIFAGGALLRLGVFGNRAVLDFTATGIALACADLAIAMRVAAQDWRLRLRSLWDHRAYWAAIAFLFMLAALQLTASSRDTTWNLNDDSGAYAAFAKEMLQNSSLHQPFSVRRLGALGGQSLLHAFLMPVVPPTAQLNILDRGMALIIAFFLLVGARREMRVVPILLLVPVAFLLGLPPVRINTASGLTGAAMFLALWRTMDWRPLDTVRSRHNAAIIGLVAAAVCTLRQNYVATAVVALSVSYLLMIVRGGRARPIRDRIRDLGEGLATAACLVLFLYPWLSLVYRSSGTFAFPIMQGNMNPEFPNFKALDMTLWREIASFWTNSTDDTAIALLPLVLVAGLALKDDGPRRALPALLVGGFVGYVMLVHSFTLAPQKDIARYFYAYEVATVLAVLLAALRQAIRDPSLGGRAPLILAGFACLAQIYESRKSVYGGYGDFIARVNAGLGDTIRPVDPLDEVYAKLQATIPPGAKILVMVNDPVKFDFKRNPIVEIDIPGAVAPHGPMPLKSGDTALGEYFQRRGIRYVVYVDFAKGWWLYNREAWQRQSNDAKGTIWQMQSSYYLGAFDAIDGLGRSRFHLAEEGSMTVLDLERRHAPSPDDR